MNNNGHNDHNTNEKNNNDNPPNNENTNGSPRSQHTSGTGLILEILNSQLSLWQSSFDKKVEDDKKRKTK